MEYIHHPYQPGETIAAIGTPPGEGGIAIVRISGNRAIEIASNLFSGPVFSYESHTAHLGVIRDSKGIFLDQALLLLMKGPRSYTGEDTVELQCHGGLFASRKVLEAALKFGARLADPGEFTFKAFMNGKLDLAQAEAVSQLISAKSEKAFEVAQGHLKGAFSQKIKEFQNELTAHAALFEAWVDFPEEGIEFRSEKEVEKDLETLIERMKKLAATFHDGQKIEQGISLCLAGPPNVGKSSLLNALIDQERAIVTEIAGTTRDLLHEDFTINGLKFKLTDTAGIRETTEVIEKEGIRRSKEAIEKSDLILFVLDASHGVENALTENLPKEKTLLVWNKIDLPEKKITKTAFQYEVHVSAKNRLGLDELKATIEKIVWEKGVPPKDEIILSSLRHYEALNKAISYLEMVPKNLQDSVSPEFLTSDIRAALKELGKIHGRDVNEDILSSIFSQFCIGK